MMRAIELIEAQQKKLDEERVAWIIGEQLKDICRHEPDAAALLEKDLEMPGMSLADAEKKFEDYALKHKKGRRSCITPKQSDEILREFYGLGSPQEASERETHTVVSLTDFL